MLYEKIQWGKLHLLGSNGSKINVNSNSWWPYSTLPLFHAIIFIFVYGPFRIFIWIDDIVNILRDSYTWKTVWMAAATVAGELRIFEKKQMAILLLHRLLISWDVWQIFLCLNLWIFDQREPVYASAQEIDRYIYIYIFAVRLIFPRETETEY